MPTFTAPRRTLPSPTSATTATIANSQRHVRHAQAHAFLPDAFVHAAIVNRVYVVNEVCSSRDGRRGRMGRKSPVYVHAHSLFLVVRGNFTLPL